MNTRHFLLLATGLLSACSDYGINQKDSNPGDTGSFSNDPIIQVSPSPVDFGAQAVGTESVVVVEVSNQGLSDLSLNGLYLHDESGVFGVTEIGVGSLGPGEIRNFVVSYSPQEDGAIESRIDIYSGDPNRPTVELPLLGDVLGPKIEISPVFYDFGVQSGSSDLNLLVENVGETTLEVTDIEYISTSPAELYLEDMGGFSGGVGSLEPGENTILVVRFSPLDASSEEGSVHISSNDPSNAVAVASQHAEGAPCEDMGWQGDFFVQTYDAQELRLHESNGDGTFQPAMVIGDTLGEIFSANNMVGISMETASRKSSVESVLHQAPTTVWFALITTPVRRTGSARTCSRALPSIRQAQPISMRTVTSMCTATRQVQRSWKDGRS